MTLEADEWGECRRCRKPLDLDYRGWVIRHSCCLCDDSGRVRLGLPLGDPDFGKSVLCECVTRGAARGAAA